MKTIPNKVIYTKEEFAELQKEFQSLKNEVKNKEIHLTLFEEFFKKLQTILDFKEDALTAKELAIIQDNTKGTFRLISR